MATNVSPYELTFGMDAVTPVETLLQSSRVMSYEEIINAEGKSVAVKLVQEKKNEALRMMVE
jgi:hypothetical protein